MSHQSSLVDLWLARFEAHLRIERYRPRVIEKYIVIVRRFLSYLQPRGVPAEVVQPSDVSAYLRWEFSRYRRHHSRSPENVIHWRCQLTSPVHALLCLVQEQWPPSSLTDPWLIQFEDHLRREQYSAEVASSYIPIARRFLAYIQRRHLTVETVQPSHVSSYLRVELSGYQRRHNRLPEHIDRWRYEFTSPIRLLLELVQGQWPPTAATDPLIQEFKAYLNNQGYGPRTIYGNIRVARRFLCYLGKRNIQVEATQRSQVCSFLRVELMIFRRREGHSPPDIRDWRNKHTGPIHKLLRFVQGQWPPDIRPADALAVFQRQICEEYIRWLSDVRGLAPVTLEERRFSAQQFLCWLGPRSSKESLSQITVTDLDAYLAWRLQGLRRRSCMKPTQCLRDFLRYLYAQGLTTRDLAPAVTGPTIYAFEGIPSALSAKDVHALLESAQQDRTPMGRRNFAVLMLLSRYGLRAGEVVQLRLNDIDWRRDRIRIRHSKTGAESFLPLLPSVGNALLDYLCHGRPKTELREIFIRSRAPYRAFRRGSSLYPIVARRLKKLGIHPNGKHGPHALRYACAASLLHATVSLKEIGDILGHRSSTSTGVYLKLATTDLRAICLEVPGEVAL